MNKHKAIIIIDLICQNNESWLWQLIQEMHVK